MNRRPSSISALQALRERCRGLRVLFAEDNLVNREGGADLLAEAGLQVDAAADGLAAVQMAARHTYAMIFMDVEMPGLDGLQATGRIRTLAGYASVPILAMTASRDPDDHQRFIAAGMSGVIAKPVGPAALHAALRDWLPGGEPGDAPAGEGEEPAPTGAESLQDRLASLEGLDFDQALEMALGRVDFLVSLLRLFAQTHAGDAARLRELLAAGDREGLGRLAHGVKGVAATLAATGLAERAARVQAGAQTAAGPAAAEVQALANELDAFIAALQAALPPGSG